MGSTQREMLSIRSLCEFERVGKQIVEEVLNYIICEPERSIQKDSQEQLDYSVYQL